MKERNETLAERIPVSVSPPDRRIRDLPRAVIGGCLVVLMAFALPLYHWFRFGLENDLFSYTLLVPVVSLYLFGIDRRSSKPGMANRAGAPGRPIGFALMALGLCALAAYGYASMARVALDPQDSVALTTLSFVLVLTGTCAATLGRADLRRAIFPLAFLLFMIPFPVAMEQAIEGFLQRGSAPPAYWFFRLVGTPVYQQDLIFQLPGTTLHIAPECSGIRSTLVLFITSLIAGQLFLRSPWKRTLLVLVILPLALLRNGFRVFVIGQLCVSVGPHMIDSFIHHKGGPIFFALSLIPLFILVFFLVRSDRGNAPAPRANVHS